MKLSSRPLIVIAGPTAIGKTDISISLAKAIGGEIISADSMQVYRGMDIGTAKIKEEEKEGIEHYLIDIMDPHEDFSVALFQKLAKEAIEHIYDNGHIPIIVGGTGFYIQSVLYDIDFDEEHTNTQYRNELTEMADRMGNVYVHEMLKDIDPESYHSIHPNNIKRVIRALEYYQETGQKISTHNEEQHKKKSPYNFLYFVINDDRELIYDRINTRVDIMIENGLVNEVRCLMDSGLDLQNISMLGLGYKEIFDYLSGLCTLDNAIELIKRDTRHFAKKQLTWFKRESDVIWIQKEDKEIMLGKMLEYII